MSRNRAVVDDACDQAVDRREAALEALLAAPSPSPKAFQEKLRTVEREYGLEWQPRHIEALLADSVILSVA